MSFTPPNSSISATRDWGLMVGEANDRADTEWRRGEERARTDEQNRYNRDEARRFRAQLDEMVGTFGPNERMQNYAPAGLEPMADPSAVPEPTDAERQAGNQQFLRAMGITGRQQPQRQEASSVPVVIPGHIREVTNEEMQSNAELRRRIIQGYNDGTLFVEQTANGYRVRNRTGQNRTQVDAREANRLSGPARQAWDALTLAVRRQRRGEGSVDDVNRAAAALRRYGYRFDASSQNIYRIANDDLNLGVTFPAGTGLDTTQAPQRTSVTRTPARSNGTSRAARNNNPGNIEFGEFAQSYGATSSDGRFAIFPSPEAGENAHRALLMSYMQRGLNTVDSIIGRWSPQEDPTNQAGSTNNYAAYVAQRLGVARGQQLQSSQLPALMQAMAEFESGNTQRDANPLLREAGLRTGGGSSRASRNLPSLGDASRPMTPNEDMRLVSMHVRNQLERARLAAERGQNDIAQQSFAAALQGQAQYLDLQRRTMLQAAASGNMEAAADLVAYANGYEPGTVRFRPVAGGGSRYQLEVQTPNGDWVGTAQEPETRATWVGFLTTFVDRETAAARAEAQAEMARTLIETGAQLQRAEMEQETAYFRELMENRRNSLDNRTRIAIQQGTARLYFNSQTGDGYIASMDFDEDGQPYTRFMLVNAEDEEVLSARDNNNETVRVANASRVNGLGLN